MADFRLNGLFGIAATDRPLSLDAGRGLGWVLDSSQAKESALAQGLADGAAGGRLSCAPSTQPGTSVRTPPSRAGLAHQDAVERSRRRGSAGTPMGDSSRQTIPVGPGGAVDHQLGRHLP